MLKVKKWVRTLMFWGTVGKGEVEGQEYDVGMGLGGGAIFVKFPEAWYVVEVSEVVRAIVEYRQAHQSDKPDDVLGEAPVVPEGG